MNNTLKKTINTTETADGTVVLTYEKSSVFEMAPSVALFKSAILGFFVVLPLKMMAGGAGGGAGIAAFILMVAVIAAAIKFWFLGKSMKLTVKPNEYLSFDSHTVPFSEIETIGTKGVVTSGSGPTRVYIVSNGTQAFVTREVSFALANALSLKIQHLSGKAWT